MPVDDGIATEHQAGGLEVHQREFVDALEAANPVVGHAGEGSLFGGLRGLRFRTQGRSSPRSGCDRLCRLQEAPAWGGSPGGLLGARPSESVPRKMPIVSTTTAACPRYAPL